MIRDGMSQTLSIVILVVILLACSVGGAQTREKGPWWPHPVWGPDDQAGASNWITPEKILESVQLVKTGEVYELGRVYEIGMPLLGDRVYSMRLVHGFSARGDNQFIYNDDFVCAEIGQVGTQFDGLGHAGRRMKMADGSERDVYYNGFTGGEIYDPNGLKKIGVENVKPIITRGILLDIAGYKATDYLPRDYYVTLEDVLAALDKAGLSEEGIRPGDALLFRYGASWDETTYATGPGFGSEVVNWIVEKKITVVGSDNIGEIFPNPDPRQIWPAHQELLTKNGIFILESMDLEQLANDQVYEFLFVLTPIRLEGGTGSPVRPLAIR
jgi:kynurenine formamidase